MRFDLIDINPECAFRWQFVFAHAQNQANAANLREALLSWQGPGNGYKVLTFKPAVFEIKHRDGSDWIVSEALRRSGRIIAETQQPDGLYQFTTRYCRCPDGVVMYFD